MAKIKLRIPIILFLIGLSSGIVQIVADRAANQIMTTVFFFGFIGVSIFAAERIGLLNKIVSPLSAVVVILLGFGIDWVTA